MGTYSPQCGGKGISVYEPSPCLLESLAATEAQLLMLSNKADPTSNVAGIRARNLTWRRGIGPNRLPDFKLERLL
jgi:hypothetical protein